MTDHEKEVAQNICEDDESPGNGELVAEAARVAGATEDRHMVPYLATEVDLQEALACTVPTPKTYKEALTGEFAPAWNKAVLRELQRLRDDEVWAWEEFPEERAYTTRQKLGSKDPWQLTGDSVPDVLGVSGYKKSVVSKHSESLLVARPDTNHKGSNDAMAAESQARVGRLPYGALGEEHQD